MSVVSACEGRIVQYRYLASKQAMMASDAATFITASTRAACASDAFWRRSAAAAVSFHSAHGSAEFHRCAIFVCSGVRSRATRRTSSIAALNAGESKAGGGPGRNWAAESMSHGRALTRAIPRGGMPRALYHMPGPVGTVPLQGSAKFAVGAQAITRRAMSTPRLLPATARSAALDPALARSRSRASSREIDARTVESANISVSTAADALATAASDDTARLSRAEFTAPYWAILRSVYTRNSIGGCVCAIRRSAAESLAAAAAALAARRLAAASSANLGTSRFQRTLTVVLSAAARVGA